MNAKILIAALVVSAITSSANAGKATRFGAFYIGMPETEVAGLKPQLLVIKEDDKSGNVSFISDDGLQHAVFEFDSEGYVQRMQFSTKGLFSDVLDTKEMSKLKCVDMRCSLREGKTKAGEDIEVDQSTITIARPGAVPSAH